jgi:alkanesulfonate monooxygenase SsuD/methylene tetrahydromethanopterin reductase-like flavin-dependent oxidoreductase (luciferase family)
MELGMFMMPIHPAHRPVSETLEENSEKVILADKLGYTEAWIGEHLSATTEPITAPMMFMASLLHQTKQIKFCTGVVNMPAHHPALVAAEAAQFDHLSRGRFMLGIGPGALASDSELFNNEDGKDREAKTLESIDLILKIWSQDPPYRLKGKYWNITIEKNVVEKLGFGYLSKPYQKPHPPIALSIMSPFSGSAKTAGIKGWAPISANFIPEYSVASHWTKYLEGCEEAKRTPRRSGASAATSSSLRPTRRRTPSRTTRPGAFITTTTISGTACQWANTPRPSSPTPKSPTTR